VTGDRDEERLSASGAGRKSHVRYCFFLGALGVLAVQIVFIPPEFARSSQISLIKRQFTLKAFGFKHNSIALAGFSAV